MGEDPYFETIAAIATSPGEGAIGIVRLSGPQARSVAGRMFRGRKGGSPDLREPFRLTLGHVVDPRTGDALDEVLAVLMPGPKSFTGEDSVEFQAHGGRVVLERILKAALSAGARPAAPGEFTRRAFVNGRLDLAQAEAVIDLIRSRSERARRSALRQLEGGLSERVAAIIAVLTELSARVEADLEFGEEVEPDQGGGDFDLAGPIGMVRDLLSRAGEGRVLREGAQIVLCGKTNVGKSSLLNQLLETDRSIVTPQPGTTRDTVEGLLFLDGFPALLIDTAGIGHPRDPVEEEGVRRSRGKIGAAEIAVVVLDASSTLGKEDHDVLASTAGKASVLVLNKSDLPSRTGPGDLTPFSGGRRVLATSALTGRGIAELRQAIVQVLRSLDAREPEDPLLTSARHSAAAAACLEALERGRENLLAERPLDLIASDLRAALSSLREITGETASKDLLDTIFSRFCIGK